MYRTHIAATLLLLLLLSACTSGARSERSDAESPSSTPTSPSEPTGTIEEQSTSLPTATVEASATPRVLHTEAAVIETPAATPRSNVVEETATPEEPVAVETTEDLTAIEILNRRSSKFPFFSDGEEVPSEEIFLEVRRVDETWRAPLAGEPFPYHEEYKGFATLNGDVGREHLRNYVMGMLRLNLAHHGYTEFVGSDYEEGTK